MKSLDELKAAVEDPRIKTDAGLFSDAIGEMLNRLYFFLEHDEFISWIKPSGFIITQTLQSAKRLKEDYTVIDHVFRQGYANPEQELIFTARHYNSWEDFQQGIMRLSSIVATSDLGMKKKIMELSEFGAQHQENDDFEVRLNEVFDAGFVVKSRNFAGDTLYHLTPKIIHAIVKQESVKRGS